ncbi:hypothetical protein KCA1_1201 [Lactiplantibacillus pentosus KCA1]|nr:hypothetical protein KCA1_1201 [Lactiplantibacillus pentosus KCA1]
MFKFAPFMVKSEIAFIITVKVHFNASQVFEKRQLFAKITGNLIV